MKKIYLLLTAIIGYVSTANAQLVVSDPASLTQQILGYVRDGTAFTNNLTLLLEGIRKSDQVYQEIKKVSENLEEISAYVRKSQLVIQCAKDYEYMYSVYYKKIEYLKANSDLLSESEMRTFINTGWEVIFQTKASVELVTQALDTKEKMSSAERTELISKASEKIHSHKSRLQVFIHNIDELILRKRTALYSQNYYRLYTSGM